MYRVLVTGSRRWTDTAKVYSALFDTVVVVDSDVTVVHGGCPTGADAIAEDIVNAWPALVVTEVHPADWSKGKRAGPIRNKEMVALGADVCLAFIDKDSIGSVQCAKAAEKAGISVRYYYGE